MSIRRVLLPVAVRDRVVAEVSAETRVPVAEIMGRSKVFPIAHARQLAIWRLREIRRGDDPAYGWLSIGAAMGLDHTTAIAAYRRVVERGDHVSAS